MMPAERPAPAALLVALLAIALALLALPARAQAPAPLRGVALVIGQSDYDGLAKLPNAAGDADAIDGLFDRLGFETSSASDRDARRLRRDLDLFVEDAEGADLAVVYYAGHAVEIAGENYLVPTDAEADPDKLSQTLVPVAEFIARLQRAARIVVVLLDACRDNPFPPGLAVRLPDAAAPEPVTVSGAAARGVQRFAPTSAASNDGYGIVLAFAAEPGKVALDGEPGGNSPYAAALLRHVSAMAGEEFGTVMRMVAEEVYLKTGGRQRPWVNESLRRLLYLGVAPPAIEGEEGAILVERRQLLLAIADLPAIGRRQVEHVAADAGVPMDALYGMLRVLGTEAPSDPSSLDALLREQSRRLSDILAERSKLAQRDPEIVRLAALASDAIGDGALGAATSIYARAKARVATLSRDLDAVESELRERRLEFARVYADSGAASELAFDFAAAAADYGRAFAEVERWDDQLAFDYRRRAVIADYRHGEYRGDAAALERVIADRDAILRLAARLPSDLPRAEALLQVGNALNVLGRQRADAATLQQAVASYEEAIPIFDAAADHFGLSRARNNLAGALVALGAREPDTRRLEAAIAIHRQLVADAPFEANTVEWMTARLNLAAALSSLGERSGSTQTMREAMDILAATVARVGPDADPILWALTQFNLSGTMLFIGQREGNPKMVANAVTASEAVLEILTRDAFPLYWASIRNNRGNAYQALGFGMLDDTFYRAAEYEYRDALEEWRKDRVPADWAMTTSNLANVLKALGANTGDESKLEQSIAAYRASMEVWTRPADPLAWATAQNNMGDALSILGARRKDPALLHDAVAAFDLALSEWTRDRVPYDWAVATNNRGGARVELGTLTEAPDVIRVGIADIEAAWAYDRETGETGYDEYYGKRIEAARAALDALGAR